MMRTVPPAWMTIFSLTLPDNSYVVLFFVMYTIRYDVLLRDVCTNVGERDGRCEGLELVGCGVNGIVGTAVLAMNVGITVLVGGSEGTLDGLTVGRRLGGELRGALVGPAVGL